VGFLEDLEGSIRAVQNLRTPDAIQLATAIYPGADYFLSNDRGLERIKEIKVLIVDDLA
jgi:predicted nucleic acid-binding protein